MLASQGKKRTFKPLSSLFSAFSNLKVRADFWEGHAMKHFAVKKRVFQNRGRQFSESGGLVRISTGKAIQ